MGRRLGGARPGVGQRIDAVMRGQPLGDEQTLQRLAPALVIVGAVAAATARDRLPDFGAERLRPFIGAEYAPVQERDGEREGLRLPGLGEDGPFCIARDRRVGGERRR